MGRYYKLKGREAVPCESVLELATAFENAESRRVAATDLGALGKVSTVFLGIYHQWGGGPPLLFESMVFGGPHDQEWQERYSTWEEAVAGHEAMVARLRELAR